ncbi:SspB family protein [Devosia algicola]|uniref:SspB family protein n=1 Tax=Devosia algicola TaxID=3026418 RepID=A0ABY7YS36_9HYPH|nr:SspB family protein [Devosia algicola]WDR03819.1 SspB family protein [Devosia algicola]
MAEDHLRYDILAQEALRGVVRKVLGEVVKTGLPGEHHFFISFVTHAPGVRISEKLLTQYEKEMTIVLQNQYWDLKVSDASFEVGLSFDGIPEHLVIPFSAVKGFFDPSVQFGLQFDVSGGESASDEDVAEPEGENNAEAAPKAETADGEDAEASGEKVVSLDAFRKKP